MLRIMLMGASAMVLVGCGGPTAEELQDICFKARGGTYISKSASQKLEIKADCKCAIEKLQPEITNAEFDALKNHAEFGAQIMAEFEEIKFANPGKVLSSKFDTLTEMSADQNYKSGYEKETRYYNACGGDKQVTVKLRSFRVSVDGKSKYGLQKSRDDDSVVVPATYDFIGGYSSGLVIASSNDKYGFLGADGKIFIPISYDNAERFSNGLALVAQGEKGNYKYGYIEPDGSFKLPLVFDDATSFYVDRAFVGKKDEADGQVEYRIIDPSGSTVSAIGKYSKVMEFESEGFARVRDESDKYGLVDRNGEVVLSPAYDYIDIVLEWVEVRLNRKEGLFKVEGDTIVEIFPPKYDSLLPPFKGRGRVELAGKFGFINEQGVEVIPLVYDSAEHFNRDGRALVTQGGESFYINEKGVREPNK